MGFLEKFDISDITSLANLYDQRCIEHLFDKATFDQRHICKYKRTLPLCICIKWHYWSKIAFFISIV